MSRPTQVHRTTIDSNELDILLPLVSQFSTLHGFYKKLLLMRAKETAGLGSAYTKSNAPKSDADKLLDAFGSSDSQIPVAVINAMEKAFDASAVDWDALTNEVLNTPTSTSSTSENTDES